jgi:secondary thiamine-phosphate synthase enzyme
METIKISTSNKCELVDITSQVEQIVKVSKTKEGICLIYTPHATAAILINENYDPKVMDDVMDALNKLIPEGIWQHDKIDNNGAAHIKAAIIGPSKTIPIHEKKLMLGQWQDIMFAEFDGPKERKIFIAIQ